MGKLFSKTKTEATTESMDNDNFKLILKEKKLEIQSLGNNIPLSSLLVEEVLLLATTSRPVIIYANDLSIFEYDSRLIAKATSIGKVDKKLFYAYFEELSQEDCDFLGVLTSHEEWSRAGVWVRLLAPGEVLKEEAEALQAESLQVRQSWCKQNSPWSEVRDAIDHDFELIGQVADAEWLVWVNPPQLKPKPSSLQPGEDTTNCDNSARNQLIEQIKEIADDHYVEMTLCLEQ